MMSQIGDSLKAFGEKTAELFKKDVTPDEIEEKANIMVIDGEKNDAMDKERESVLFQFQKVSDGLDIEEELNVAQLKGDIKRAYPDGGLPMAPEKTVLHEPASATAEGVLEAIEIQKNT